MHCTLISPVQEAQAFPVLLSALAVKFWRRQSLDAFFSDAFFYGKVRLGGNPANQEDKQAAPRIFFCCTSRWRMRGGLIACLAVWVVAGQLQCWLAHWLAGWLRCRMGGC